MNLLNDLTEGEEEKEKHSTDSSKPMTTDSHTHAHLRKCTIQAMSNLLNANIDSGLTHSIGKDSVHFMAICDAIKQNESELGKKTPKVTNEIEHYY